MREQKDDRVTARISRRLKKLLIEYCQQEDCTEATTIRKALKMFLEKKPHGSR